jgi:molybdopterin molybdotransferase
MALHNISFSKAYKIVTTSISPLPPEKVSLDRAVGRVVSEDVISLINSPSADVSLKDGYAVISEDIEKASPESPVTLELIGAQFAGSPKGIVVTKGKAVRITSGATVPYGADAVLSEEFATESNGTVTATADAHKGRNILRRGKDILKGERIIKNGTLLTPPDIGLLAAAGHAFINVYKNPAITIIATGDEVVAICKPVEEGKLAASNLATISAWCIHFGLENNTVVIGDSEDEITKTIKESIYLSDCLITSGGAWKGERDLVVKVLDKLGWQKLFHRVKIGPGKAIGFGFLDSKPVFCLPGGPPSNQMAFLNLALPGVLRLCGRKQHALPVISAELEKEVKGQKDWTQFIMGSIFEKEDRLIFSPITVTSRLQYLSKAEGIIFIPEGVESIPCGSIVKVHMLR